MARILIVEDDGTIRAMQSRILSGAGHEVIEAKDGASALAAIKENVPDLVILDVMMAGLSGFEVARLLRAQPSTATIPVLFVTSRTSASAMDEGLEAGGSAYLTKPFSSSRLLQIVDKLLADR